MWKKHSENYSKYFESVSNQIYEILLNLSNIKEAQKIAEVSCGTGNGIKIIREKFNSNSEIYASDISKFMISKAKSRGLPGINFTISDNSLLPYRSDFFDSYLSSLSLHISRKKQEAVKESFRVLKQGGKACFSVFTKPSEKNIIHIIEKNCEINNFWLKHQSLFGFSDENDLKNLLKTAGFQDLATHHSVHYFDLKTVEEALEFAYDLFLYQKLKQNPTDVYKAVLKSLEAEFQEVIGMYGKFSLEIGYCSGRKLG